MRPAKLISVLIIFIVSFALADSPTKQNDAPTSVGEKTTEKKPKKIVKSEVEWRKQLSRMAYKVTRQGATERARTGRYWNYKVKGTYLCVCCDQPLFSSKTKFKSGTGWPSFYAPVKKQHVGERIDRGLFSTRMEVVCTRCDAHLGHVFGDGPRPTGLRYCVNSAALKFEAAKPAAKKKAADEKTEESASEETVETTVDTKAK